MIWSSHADVEDEATSQLGALGVALEAPCLGSARGGGRLMRCEGIRGGVVLLFLAPAALAASRRWPSRSGAMAASQAGLTGARGWRACATRQEGDQLPRWTERRADGRKRKSGMVRWKKSMLVTTRQRKETGGAALRLTAGSRRRWMPYSCMHESRYLMGSAALLRP
jgi:hypothetical protein